MAFTTGVTGWTNAQARSSAWSRLRLPSRLPTCTARRSGWSPTRFSRCPRAEERRPLRRRPDGPGRGPLATAPGICVGCAARSYGTGWLPRTLSCATAVAIRPLPRPTFHFPQRPDAPEPCLSTQGACSDRAHETPEHLVCRLLLEKKKIKTCVPAEEFNAAGIGVKYRLNT